MSEVVKTRVELRDAQKNKGTGTRVARRLRKSGRIPAVIYGHKQAVVPVTLSHDDVLRMVKTPGHLAELDLGGATTETVLIRDVQWDHLGKEILHLDFARVNAEEVDRDRSDGGSSGRARRHRRGGNPRASGPEPADQVAAPGRSLDSIKVDVSHLQVDQGIHVRDLTLPPDVSVDADPDVLLVHVVTRAAAPEPAEAAVESPTQPEVIKPERKEKEKED